MTIIYLVRHGQAAERWGGTNQDPGLDDIGRAQANQVAQFFSHHLPMPILSSPLLRAQETAQPLASQWQQTINIEPRFREVPSPNWPDHLGPREKSLERRNWLQNTMSANWPELDDRLHQWRSNILQALLEIAEDSVVFSHFLTINTVFSLATGSEKMMSVRPANGSIHQFDVVEGKLTLREKGQELKRLGQVVVDDAEKADKG